MKKIALIAVAAAAFSANPAMAQATGTINLTGVVASKCFVEGTPIGGTHDFTALDATNGTMRTDLATDFGTKNFTVKCSSLNPTVSVKALPLATTATATAGYDNSIDYNAIVTVDKSGGGTTAVTDASTDTTATTGTVGARLANSTNNVRVTTASYATGSNTDLLVAGTYNGSIEITISPTN
ncbi:MAG: hypothetical protein RL519_608 [Pseudomonadota bacterium]|jgi:hypothetical protein